MWSWLSKNLKPCWRNNIQKLENLTNDIKKYMVNTVPSPDSGNTCLMLSANVKCQVTEAMCEINIHRL